MATLRFENARIASDWHLTEGNYDNRCAKEGNGWVKPWFSNKRVGAKALAIKVNATASGKQRCEYPMFDYYGSHVKLNPGTKRYCGFSMFLADNGQFPAPKSWFNIHQAKQFGAFFPFVQFGFYKNDGYLGLQYKSGNTGKYKRIFKPERGVWYDVVVGYQFEPLAPKGWVICWIKKSAERTYKAYKFTNTKVGSDVKYHGQYTGYHNAIGIYKDADNQSHKMYFDEVRWSTYFDGAKIPGSLR